MSGVSLGGDENIRQRVKQKLSRKCWGKGQESGSGGTNLTENEAGVEERGSVIKPK